MRNPLIIEHVLVNDHRIAAGAHGEGEPVVLLHGTPSSLIWRNVAPRLIAAGMRVHLFDLLGYGLSERPHPAEVDTSMSAQTEGSNPGLDADHPRRLRALRAGGPAGKDRGAPLAVHSFGLRYISEVARATQQLGGCGAVRFLRSPGG